MLKQESLDAARHSMKVEEKTVAHVLETLDETAFVKAVELLKRAPRIMTSGCGNSGIAAKKFAHCLCCMEYSGMFMPPGEAPHGGMGFLKQGDVLILLSRGGKTKELLPMAEIAKRKGAYLITVTERADSDLATMADVTLLLHDITESDPTGLMATSSFIAPVVLFDALLSALICETGYSGKQFAVIHPGGAVGEELNRK